MAKKTLTVQLQEAKERIAKLESQLKEYTDTQVFEPKQEPTLHELLDAATVHLKKNSFVLRGVDSKGIASLVRSARERLRIATKK